MNLYFHIFHILKSSSASRFKISVKTPFLRKLPNPDFCCDVKKNFYFSLGKRCNAFIFLKLWRKMFANFSKEKKEINIKKVVHAGYQLINAFCICDGRKERSKELIDYLLYRKCTQSRIRTNYFILYLKLLKVNWQSILFHPPSRFMFFFSKRNIYKISKFLEL